MPVSTPILTTKLYIPPTRPDLVPRPRLIERLNDGLHRKLTLISAPAGFGKTTLVSDWLRQIDLPAAWLSLDEGDNDPTRFLTYFIAALRQVDSEIGQTAQSMLQSHQPPPAAALMTALINDIVAFSNKIVLVLDDYQAIQSSAMHQAVTFLLEHQPAPLHLLITSRTEPPLPLPRLRARGQLLELGIDTLRFSLAEAEGFLNQVLGLTLSAEDVATLHTRTEGWATGLQLAALALQAPVGRPAATTITRFIADFSGKDRYVGEYLLEEVFRRQDEKIQTFLLQTSILGQLTGALCDHVTGQSDGREMLARLVKANLFIVPLDNEGRWYRYHPLFVDFLKAQLQLYDSQLEPVLHCRAAEWYVEQDLTDQAIGHTLAAKDFDQAARLIEQITTEKLWWEGEFITLASWLNALPNEQVSVRLHLVLAQAWVLLMSGQEREKLAGILQQLEASLKANSLNIKTTVKREDSLGSDRIKGEIATLLAEDALTQNDLPRALTLSQQALALLPEAELTFRSMATQIQGYVYRLTGQVEQASQALIEAGHSSRQAGNVTVATFALSDLGEVQLMQGQLHQADQTYRQTLELAAEHNAWPFPPTSAAYIGLGNLLYEWNELERAGQHLQKAVDLSQQGGYAGITVRAYLSLAQLKQSQGKGDERFEMLTRAKKLIQKYPSARMDSYFTLTQVRLWLLAGEDERAAASRWADVYEQNLDTTSPPSTYLEFREQITLARVRLTQHKPDHGLLAALLQQAEAAGWTWSVIEILILQALARQMENDLPVAMSALVRALSLAEPENYIRLFVGEGAPMIRLLQKAVSYGATSEYVGRLQASFMPSIEGTAPEAQPLLEPLTKRELEVLKLMAAGLSNREIANDLVIAMGTVAKYSNNIYSKLAVTNRTQAVSCAHTLNLI